MPPMLQRQHHDTGQTAPGRAVPPSALFAGQQVAGRCPGSVKQAGEHWDNSLCLLLQTLYRLWLCGGRVSTAQPCRCRVCCSHTVTRAACCVLRWCAAAAGGWCVAGSHYGPGTPINGP